MSKLLKIASFIVGAVIIVASGGLGTPIATAVTGALASAGITTAVLTISAVALAIGASLLAPKQIPPSNSQSNEDRFKLSLIPKDPRVSVFGRTAMATQLRDQEFSGADKEYVHRFMVVAAHTVNSIEELWFDDKLAWSSAGGVQGEYVGYLDVTAITEGTPANAINISARLGANRRFTGCAYVYMRYKVTGNTKKSVSPFASSLPVRITCIGEGMPCYDPRQDSTLSAFGGSGSHRADDQTTWTYGEHARNPACQLATHLLGWKIQNPQSLTWKLSVGRGMPPDRIDWESFIESANLCDEPVSLLAGGTEPRYRGDGLFSEGDDPTKIIEVFKSTMNAEFDDQDGLLNLYVLHNDLAEVVIDITDDDVMSPYQWSTDPGLNEGFNVIAGSFSNPDDKALYQPTPYGEISLKKLDGVTLYPDGIERTFPADYLMVQSKGQGRRLAKQRLQREQYKGTFQATFGRRLWQAPKNSIVRFTSEVEGFSNLLFRIVETATQQNGLVPALLRLENAAIYAWDHEEGADVQIADPLEYSPTEDPLVQLLGLLEDFSADFESSNNQNGDPIPDPVVLTDGTAVDHTLNANGGIDLSFEWAWSGDEETIDGFEIRLYSSSSTSPYTPGASPALENKFIGLSNIRAIFERGLPAEKRYTWFVRAYRRVDVNVDASGIIVSNWVKSTRSEENPYHPISVNPSSGDITTTISGTAASNVASTVGNFNARNDRDSSTVVDPVIAGDGTAIDHTNNTNGSVDISFEWTWSGDEGDIDYFQIMVVGRVSSSAYTIGGSPSLELKYNIPPNCRAFFMMGVSAFLYWTFYVTAIRVVDPDVPGNVDGLLRSNHRKSTASGENPYRPVTSDASSGDITTTVNGTAASNVSTAVTNFNSRKHRDSSTPPTPTVQVDGTAIDHVNNPNGSVDISFEWGFGGVEANQSGFEVMVYTSPLGTSYTPGSSPAFEHVTPIPINKRAVFLYGARADLNYTFAVRTYRDVDPDVDASQKKYSIWNKSARSEENPYKPSSVSGSAGDITTTVGGVDAVVLADIVDPVTGDVNDDKVGTDSIQDGAIGDGVTTGLVSSLTLDTLTAGTTFQDVLTLNITNASSKVEVYAELLWWFSAIIDPTENSEHEFEWRLVRNGSEISGSLTPEMVFYQGPTLGGSTAAKSDRHVSTIKITDTSVPLATNTYKVQARFLSTTVRKLLTFQYRRRLQLADLKKQV